MRKVLVLFVFCFLLSACFSQPRHIENTATPLSFSLTQKPTDSEVVSSPSPSVKASPIPTSTSFVSQLVVTLTPFASDLRITKLFESPICKLPCWWNIIPGKTSWKNTEDLFLFLGLEPKSTTTTEFTEHEVKIIQTESMHKTSIRAYEKNSLVEFIAIESFLPEEELKRMYSDYEPRRIIQSYGIPSRVFVSASLIGQGSYTLDLFYDDQDFLIVYGGSIQKTANNSAVVCPDFSKGAIGGIQVYIQSKTIDDKLENFPDEELTIRKKISEPSLRPIKDATGLTIKDFINMFTKESPSYCFTVQK